MRGGSRYGAGRPGWRRKCERQLQLDVRRLQRAGRLDAEQSFGWQWTQDGEQSASIGIRTEIHAIYLHYTWTPYGHEPQRINCRVPITRTLCTYGRSRPWFLCPDCGRRCAILYGISRYGNFACRVCRRLAYTSEAENPLDRLWRKQSKIEAKLDQGELKPKGMRWRTYEKLMDKIENLEQQKDELFFAYFGRRAREYGMSLKDLLD